MSQVKEWCGNISDDEKASGLKRKFETDDSDEDYDDKKIKLEEDSDDSAKHSKSKTPIKKGKTFVLFTRVRSKKIIFTFIQYCKSLLKMR